MEKIVVMPIESDYAVESDEAALIEEAQTTNPLAFDTLYQRYLARVYRYLRARSEGDEDAADLTQQVFLQAFHALPGYQQRGLPFAAWLFQIARHVAADKYRRHRATLSLDTLPVAFEAAGDEQDPESIALQQERLARLRMLVAKLDDGKRELLALRFAAGLSSSQIAAVLGKSPAAIKKQLTRIIATLKEQYHER
jgi:RNA polymerase sigma-70 factor (ECF subfamily)